MNRSILIGAAASLVSLSACGQPDYFDPAKPAADETKVSPKDGKNETWTAQDAPTIFSATGLKFKMSELPDSGEVTNIPWASSYWPYYQDSINYRWSGSTTDSPAMKYQKAFGGTGVEDAVSRSKGILSNARKECGQDSDCTDLKDGSVCAKRSDQERGRCYPTWWGICPGWTASAILTAEPKRPVTKNGVEFKVNDIKALVSFVHEANTASKFISLRCNKNEPGPGWEAPNTIEFDDYGRPKDEDKECRDTNAATYHILLTNYLGIMKQSFAEDRFNDFEVWNQPLRAYRITSKKEVDAAEANRLIGVTNAGGTTKNEAASVAKDEWRHYGPFTVAAGSNYKVAMTGDNDADLHVNFGAQATDSQYACRPYDNGSVEACEAAVPAGQTQLFVSVKGYAATSAFQLTIATGGAVPSKYQFNSAAVKFFYVKTEVDYVGESDSTTDGNLRANIDRYTHTDKYEYVLEADANGSLIGGEWVGSSKTSHPDFLWLPTGVQRATVAEGKISYAQVKALLDESVGPTTPTPTTTGEKTVTDSATLAKNVWKQYGPFDVAPGGRLVATTDGAGDVDLYVRKSAAPTLTSYECRPYQSSSNESCTVPGPSQVYVGVLGYAASSTYTIVIKYDSGTGTVTPPAPPTTFTHLNVSGAVAQGELKTFELPVTAGKRVVIRTTSSADVDLYTLMGRAPTTSEYGLRGYTTSGNESVTFTATESGTLYVAVHGYAAGSFTLKTSDN